jgi:hypothetical protein
MVLSKPLHLPDKNSTLLLVCSNSFFKESLLNGIVSRHTGVELRTEHSNSRSCSNVCCRGDVGLPKRNIGTSSKARFVLQYEVFLGLVD